MLWWNKSALNVLYFWDLRYIVMGDKIKILMYRFLGDIYFNSSIVLKEGEVNLERWGFGWGWWWDDGYFLIFYFVLINKLYFVSEFYGWKKVEVWMVIRYKVNE